MHVDIQPFFKNINPKTYSRMELQDIHYNKAEYVETVRNRVALGYILFHKLFACSQIPHKHCFFLLIKLQTIKMNLCLFFLLMNLWRTFYLQASGNKVSRQTVLCGSQNIVLHGKVIVQSDAIIRGDLANVRSGRYCIISKRAVLRPPFKKFSKG